MTSNCNRRRTYCTSSSVFPGGSGVLLIDNNRDISVIKDDGSISDVGKSYGDMIGTCIINGKNIYVECSYGSGSIKIKEYDSNSDSLSIISSISIGSVSSFTCNEYGVFAIVVDRDNLSESIKRVHFDNGLSNPGIVTLYHGYNSDVDSSSIDKIITYKGRYLITNLYNSGLIIDMKDNYKRYKYSVKTDGGTNVHLHVPSGYYTDAILYSSHNSYPKLWTFGFSLEDYLKTLTDYDSDPNKVNIINLLEIYDYYNGGYIDNDSKYYEDDTNVIFAMSNHDRYNHRGSYRYTILDKDALSLTNESVEFTNTDDEGYSSLGYSVFYDSSTKLLYSGGVCISLENNTFMQDKCHSNRPVEYVIPAWNYSL